MDTLLVRTVCAGREGHLVKGMALNAAALFSGKEEKQTKELVRPLWTILLQPCDFLRHENKEEKRA